MTFFCLAPAYAGAATGPNDSQSRPLPTKCEFETWTGDVLVSIFPCWFLVTDSTKDAILSAAYTGTQFDTVAVFKSDQFDVFWNHEMMLPRFSWLKVDGKAGQDDFGVTHDFHLVVSERALKLLQHLGIPNADATNFKEQWLYNKPRA
jgi:hypothetical protein